MNILVLIHSRSGNCLSLAEAAQQGAASIDGVNVQIKRAPDLEPEETLAAHPWSGPVYRERIRPIPCATLADLAAADGLILGSGTRFGTMSASLKHFLDQAGPLWRENALQGRPAGVMAVSSTPHGGVEQACMGMMVSLMHFGMIIVPCGYSEKVLSRAGSPYGAVAIAGGFGQHKITEDDLEVARYLGRRVAEVTKQLKAQDQVTKPVTATTL
ncbi:MAG TPA: NAD(P)H:quinone oxidoreductase [Ktedonobacteraceae bacterium]|nr:NAD(P)H:quinone oxidoreductase [Ktedonobacteraceae bacterium]